jgi:hypothetical protein
MFVESFFTACETCDACDACEGPGAWRWAHGVAKDGEKCFFARVGLARS